MEYVYHMRDPKRARLFLQDLHSGRVSILDSGVIFSMKGGGTDWHIFVNADDSALKYVEVLLTDNGVKVKASQNTNEVP
jgi:hypothetical protein